MVVVAVELSRLLRRGLFVAVIAVAGWLLSALFATSASAEESPNSAPVQPQGLLGGLLGGVTNTLTGLTGTVVDVTGTVLNTTVDTAASVLAPSAQPAPAPIIELPQLLPSYDGHTETDREVATPVAPPPAPVVPAPVAAPPPVTTPAPAPAPAPLPAAPVSQSAQLATDDDATTDEQTGEGVPEPQPVKAPATPAGPAPTAAPSHDNSGGARTAHGVLPAQATLHPADAGFTTRSRAVNSAGRSAGLPASSPD